MTRIEQAVFTSAETSRAAGYQIVARSPGVSDEDARELAVWCPSHDSLWDRGPDAMSFNFHPLPSGNFCASRTVPAGREYSGRRGARIYTQCLIVPPDALARFGNNPFALLRAALAAGSLRVHDEVPRHLTPLTLVGRAAAVDTGLLARLTANPGPEWMAALVEAALESDALALVGGPGAVHLVAGLINCLPPECRTEFSFSTGLRFSAQRPYRIAGLPSDPAERRRIAQRPGAVVLDLDGDPPDGLATSDGWARLILRVLKTGRSSFLATQFSKRRFELRRSDLPALGLQLLEELDATTLRDARPGEDDPAPAGRAHRYSPAADDLEGPGESAPWDRPLPGTPEEDQKGLTRSHAAHRHASRSGPQEPSAAPTLKAPSRQLDPESPEVLEKLELLDDVVFEAIGGDATCQEQLENLWPEVRAELGDALVAESREQYLRYALSIWEECLEPSGIRNPARAASALDVLCVLFDE